VSILGCVLGSAIKGILGGLLESIPGGIVEKGFRPYLGTYSTACGNLVIKWNWKCI
jgi:hypothetical protein